ncbi:ROK family protein [Microbacterium sp. 22215]|uniref:ROK family protein n=1 Tax=Microbacterium sp. 22215 TaxID=3453893 RepID=UPI003F838699
MADHTQTLALIIDLIRSGRAVTRPELARQTDLGRGVIGQRVEDGIVTGLLVEDNQALSTGGRPSKVLRIAAERGIVLAAVFGASRLHVAVADLSGKILNHDLTPWNVDDGPESSLAHLISRANQLLEQHPGRSLWAAAVGVPGPVNFRAGRPVAPPIMPGWDNFPIRERLEARFDVPVWVDNDVNLMALGAWHETRLDSGDDMILVKAGTGVGAGLISHGLLHRGARGGAGDIAHNAIAERSTVRCRCGNLGCLEAYAGGWALARDAELAARSGESEFLANLVKVAGQLSVEDVITGALNNEAVCVELVGRAGTLIGRELSVLVNFFNPATVLISGSLIRTNELFLTPLRDAVAARSLPIATEELVLAEAPLAHSEGIIGAAVLALNEVFSARFLSRWIGQDGPRGLRSALAETVTSPLAATKRNLRDDAS